MSESIKRRTAAMQGSKEPAQVRKLAEAALVDLAAVKTENASLVVDVTALAAAVDTLAAKLNADAGVTDIDYSVVNEDAVTSTTPATLTLTS